MTERHAEIAALGSYLPTRVVTNQELEQKLGTPVHEWLVENVGIRERRFMADTETTSDLAVNAARCALDRARLAAKDLDLIIVATDTPDHISPATAAVVQHKLSAQKAAAYDVNAACAGWVTALDLAAKTVIVDPAYTHVLVIGAYGMSRFVDWSDKKTCTIFADGAGAAIVRASTKPGIAPMRLRGFGEFHDALGIYTGGAARPATAANVAKYGAPAVQFVRRVPPSFNAEHWPQLIRDAAAAEQLSLDDVRLFVFTQLNVRTIQACMDALSQPMSKTHVTMDKWGYTGSACLPMTLDDAQRQGKLQPGDRAVLCASGGGLAMAAGIITWNVGRAS
jgi:3-oxoacyl-[acyl-carrier-protein] synthase-3